MSEQFSRTELLIGYEGLEKLKNSHVAIFGVGGVGGYALEALLRSGIGKISLIDNDVVSKSNINRQIIALNSTIGKYKVDVAKMRALDINPLAEIVCHKTFYTPKNKDEFDFSKYDYVIDAIDTVVGKLSIIEECYKTKTKIISSMGAGNKLNPCDFLVDDIYNTSMCPLARVIRQELKKRKISKLKVVYSKEKPISPKKIIINPQAKKQTPASIAFVPSVAGLIIASEVIKDLINN